MNKYNITNVVLENVGQYPCFKMIWHLLPSMTGGVSLYLNLDVVGEKNPLKARLGRTASHIN